MLRPLVERNTGRRITWAFLLILLATTSKGLALKTASIAPSCKIDLSFLGKVVEPPLSHLVQFVGNGTVAVAIAVHNTGSPKLVRRGETGERSAYVLHTALVDANTGRILREARWPTDFPSHSGFIAAINSKLVVLLGDHVAVAGNNIELLKQIELPGDSGQAWVGRSSPSGRNAVFVEDTGLKPGSWAWVDLSQLRVLRVWRDVPHVAGGRGSPVSDKYITFIRCQPSGVPPCTLIAQSLNEEPLRTIGGINLRYGLPEFVRENLLVVHGFSGDTSVVNLTKMRVIRHLGPGFIGRFFGLPATAPNVSRFVVPAFSQDLVMQYLNVFDGQTASLHVFRIRGLPPAGSSQPFSTYPWGIALSPDGKLLAYFKSFRTLLVFRLPPPEAH